MASKSTLSSLSSLIPTKGEAARAETVPEVPKAAELPNLPGPIDEDDIREGLTIRIKRRANQRLRRMKFMENRSKQSLLDEAIDTFLDRSGY